MAMHIAAVDLIRPTSVGDAIAAHTSDLFLFARLVGPASGRLGRARAELSRSRRGGPQEREHDVVVLWRLAESGTAPESMIRNHGGLHISRVIGCYRDVALVTAYGIRDQQEIGPAVAAVVGGEDF